MSENRTLKKEMYYDEAIRLHFELGYGEDRVAEILPIGHTTAWRWFRKFAAENKVKTTSMARTKKKTAPKASDGEAKDDRQIKIKDQGSRVTQDQGDKIKIKIKIKDQRSHHKIKIRGQERSKIKIIKIKITEITEIKRSQIRGTDHRSQIKIKDHITRSRSRSGVKKDQRSRSSRSRSQRSQRSRDHRSGGQITDLRSRSKITKITKIRGTKIHQRSQDHKITRSKINKIKITHTDQDHNQDHTDHRSQITDQRSRSGGQDHKITRSQDHKITQDQDHKIQDPRSQIRGTQDKEDQRSSKITRSRSKIKRSKDQDQDHITRSRSGGQELLYTLSAQYIPSKIVIHA